MTDDVELPSGIAVLAADEPDWSDGPFKVRGVALPEDIEPNSANSESLEADERVRTYWPPEVVEDTATLFEGAKIVDGSEHDPQAVMDNPQPNPETIIGEITDAEYEPGTGVLYEGEVDDPEIAKRIDRGRVDVSPTLFRQLADGETDSGARPVESVSAVRDLSIVAEGAADGNSIQPATAAMSAMAAQVLEGKFDGAETFESVAGVSFDDTADGELDESEIDDNFGDHYLYGSGDDKEDHSYPVVDADGNLRKGNVEAAHSLGCRGDCPGDEEHADNLEALAEQFDDPPEFASEQMRDEPAESGADTAQHDDGTDGSESQSSVAVDDASTMSDDDTLSDTERAILEAADNLDEPIETLDEYAAADEPAIVEQNEVETLEDKVATLEDMMDERLVEDTGLSEATVEAMSFEAKEAEFQDDDGNFDAEVLVQQPETGSPEGDFDDGGEVETLIDEVGFDADDRDDLVETLEQRYQNFQSNGWDSQAEQAADRLERLGVEV